MRRKWNETSTGKKQESYEGIKETSRQICYDRKIIRSLTPKKAYHKQSSKFFAKFYNCTTCMAASMKNIKTPRTLKRQKEDD